MSNQKPITISLQDAVGKKEEKIKEVREYLRIARDADSDASLKDAALKELGQMLADRVLYPCLFEDYQDLLKAAKSKEEKEQSQKAREELLASAIATLAYLNELGAIIACSSDPNKDLLNEIVEFIRSKPTKTKVLVELGKLAISGGKLKNVLQMVENAKKIDPELLKKGSMLLQTLRDKGEAANLPPMDFLKGLIPQADIPNDPKLIQ